MDKYDRQILELTCHPDRIGKHWIHGWGLFQFATPTGKADNDTHPNCGCLTMIAGMPDFEAPTEDLTWLIRNDERIPVDSEFITVESLPVFAEWQRRLDKTIRAGYVTSHGPYAERS